MPAGLLGLAGRTAPISRRRDHPPRAPVRPREWTAWLARAELARACVEQMPEVVLADAGYWHQVRMERLVAGAPHVVAAGPIGCRDSRP